jgi:hypothetical protein
MTGKWWEMFVFGEQTPPGSRSTKRSKHEDHAEENIAYETEARDVGGGPGCRCRCECQRQAG